MDWHIQREEQRLRRRLDQGDPLWPAQLAIATAIACHLLVSDKLVIGPTWLVPGVAGVLLVVLIFDGPRRASEKRNARQRILALALLGLLGLAYLVSLVLLVHYLIVGGQVDGRQLIESGIVLWATNVLIFSVLYWEMDRGGPFVRFHKPKEWPDFQFPQMENPELIRPGWQPGFIDYLYTSLTNATAFSPTDTMPLTQIAKVLMGVQGTAALVTVGLVLARAVNILG
jgi:hypothetical protein